MKEQDIKNFITVYNDVHTYPNLKDVAKELGINERTVRKRAKNFREMGMTLTDRSKVTNSNMTNFPDDMQIVEADEELLAENVKLAKQKQRYADKTRIERKAFREHARIENSVSEFTEQLVEQLGKMNLSKKVRFHNKPSEKVGIIHWSDQHLNEQVNLATNKYNWDVAAKRLKKHVDLTRHIAKAFGITKLLVAMTGDILNSDRRMDELLGNAQNRAKACVLAVDLYQQALLDLNQDFDLTVAAISGNESRIPKDIGFNPEVASDNYDFTIYEMLRKLLHTDGIEFVAGYDPSEVVVDVNGQHVLLMHGHGGINNNKPGSSIQQIKGRYNAKGVKIDLVLWGHVHEAMIGDLYARSSSLVGANDYSEKALNLDSRASQNFYVLNQDGGFHGIKFDLQNTDDIKGYNIDKEFESYNTKSKDKLRQDVVIHRVVI